MRKRPLPEEPAYTVYRFYYDSSHPDNQKEILKLVTREEALAHCQRDDTREPGVWFDGFDLDPDYDPDQFFEDNPELYLPLSERLDSAGEGA